MIQHQSPHYSRFSVPVNNLIDNKNQAGDTLLVWIECHTAIYHMVLKDLTQVFSRYGSIQSIQMLNDGNFALIQYMNNNSAALAMQNLDGRPLKGILGTLRVQPLSTLMDDDSSEDSGESPLNSKIVKKYTVRYDVQIDPDDGFDIAKRIIGIKGINMKHIHSKTNSKLRLRGKGSGYLEGHNRKEAPELLHLCVSCQDYNNYSQACQMVEELFIKIYNEYDTWRRDNGLEALFLRPKYSETLIQFPIPYKNLKIDAQEQDSYNIQKESMGNFKITHSHDPFIDYMRPSLRNSLAVSTESAVHNILEQSHSLFPAQVQDDIFTDESNDISHSELHKPNVLKHVSSNFRNKVGNPNLEEHRENAHCNLNDNPYSGQFLQNLNSLAYILKNDEFINGIRVNSPEIYNQLLETLPLSSMELHNKNNHCEVDGCESLPSKKALRSCNESFFGPTTIKPLPHINEIISSSQFSLNY